MKPTERRTTNSQSKPVRTVQTIRWCMLAALALYFVLAMRLPPSNHAASLGTIEIAIALVSLTCVTAAFYWERKFVRKAEALMTERPDDARALKRWCAGYIGIYAASLGVALYGLVLHFLGAPLLHVNPFFLVAAALILWFRPRLHNNSP